MELLRAITFVLSMLCGIFLVGCSSIRSMDPYKPTVTYANEKRKNYTVGLTKIAFVGEAIIENCDYKYIVTSASAYKAIKDAGRHIRVGSVHPVIGTDSKGEGLYILYYAQNTGIRISFDGILLDEHMFYYNLGGWQNHLMVNVGGSVGEKMFEAVETTKKLSDDSFKVELIYTGFDGSNIKVAYREYKNDLARPAFYQDMTYNISKSKTIRYKNYRILVMKATNEEIEYVVAEE